MYVSTLNSNINLIIPHSNIIRTCGYPLVLRAPKPCLPIGRLRRIVGLGRIPINTPTKLCCSYFSATNPGLEILEAVYLNL